MTAKNILRDFADYRRELLASTEMGAEVRTPAQRSKHKQQLEADIEEWVRFFFPTSARYDFAPFHKRFFKRILANPEWYEVLSWSRELSKTTCTMFMVMYLILTGKKRNVLLISNSYDNAERLLEPYRAHLDSNRRIAAYYGEQRNAGSWESGEFRANCGATLRACGALQSPRGTKTTDDIRPDCIILDDFDTDEECRNPETIRKKWDWFESAVYPTRSISEPTLILWLGNIIAKDCCIVRAAQFASHHDIVNIRDGHGNSTWAAKNSEEQIDLILSKISTRAQQQEYYNNPISEGDVFKEITWGKCPSLSRLEYVISYADPSPASSDRRKVGTSFKANFLVGCHEGKFYIYTGFLEQVTNADFVLWNYALRDYARGKTQVFYYIENNTLQNPFYEQVYIPLFQKYGAERGYIPITPDTRRKPDKAVRIEGTLEPLNRLGMLVLNEAERGNPNMQRLEEQFKLFTPQLRAPADGPDCIEGAVYLINERISPLHELPSMGRRQHKNLW